MVWRAVILSATAAAAAFAPVSPAAVERMYSSRVYPALQQLVTTASNAVPMALFDVLIAIVVLGWLALAAADVFRRGLPRALARIALRTVTLAAATYLVFLALWGLNYRRVPLGEKLQFSAGGVTPKAARLVAVAAVDRLNGLHADAHAAGWAEQGVIDPGLNDGFVSVQRDIGAAAAAVPGRPKHTVFDLYFRLAGVEGMTDPFFLETLVASDLLPFERPLVVAHEWAHLAGLADESEANFVGALACLRGPVPVQYSAWLFLLSQIAAGLPAPDRRGVMQSLGDGPRRDLAAIAARNARNISPRVASAGWRVYDRYLKANRVEAGVTSYAQVVRLMLGTELGRRTTAAP